MIHLTHKDNWIRVRAISSQGGSSLAAFLAAKTIPEKKKKFDRGEVLIHPDCVNEVANLIRQHDMEYTNDISMRELYQQKKKERQQKKTKVTFHVHTINTQIEGGVLPTEKIEKATRFFLMAAINTKSYKNGKWDGYVNLYKKATRTFPTGLLQRVMEVLQKEGYEYEVNYCYERFPAKQYDWELIDGIIPDQDQLDAVQAIVEHGRGIVKAPTGWGKTAVFAKRLIVELGVPALFIANKKQLLDDARDDFEHGIAGAACIAIKDGHFGSVKLSKDTAQEDLMDALDAPIIVATVQSLESRLNDERTNLILRDWLKNTCKLVIVDESQAVGTKIWDHVLEAVRAPYRALLSATPKRTDGATIKLEAAAGPVVFTTTAREQIEKGRLCELDIQYHVFDQGVYNDYDDGLRYDEVYRTFIVENEERNNKLVDEALKMVQEGRHVLLLVQMIDHGHILREKLIQAGLDPSEIRFIWGSTKTKERHAAIAEFRKGDFKVMIGSVIFDVGVNIPIISGVVLAGAGNSDITLIQRIGRGARNFDYELLDELPEFMKEAHGKKETKIVDLYDTNIKFFPKQADNRYRNAIAEFGKERVHFVGTIVPKKKKGAKNRPKEEVDESFLEFCLELENMVKNQFG